MIIDKRGKNVALAGAALQVVFTAFMLGIYLATSSVAALSAMAFAAAGVPVWVMAATLLYCRQLQKREEAELEDLRSGKVGASAIFERPSGDMAPAAQRVRFMEKWAVPGFTLTWAILQAGVLTLSVFSYVPRVLRRAPVVEEPVRGMIFALIAAFAALLFSRYAVGMAARREWRLLRAGGSYLTVNTLAMAGVAGALLGVSQDYPGIDVAVMVIVLALQAVLTVELVLVFILDIFRPRLPHQEDRPGFDSRLYGLVAEPQKIGHSIAETINYQFGFEVSKSWFYQLVARSIIPLLIAGAVVLLGASSVVVVEAGERYAVLHLGRPDRILKPGLHFKWPWPIDRAWKFQVGSVQEILLGVGDVQSAEERASAFARGRELYLWTEEHGAMEEKDFLVAVARRQDDKGATTSTQPATGPAKRDEDTSAHVPAVSLIKLVVSVQYKIDEDNDAGVWQYGFGFADPRKLLANIAAREMTNYCASATLDTVSDAESGGPPSAAVLRPEAIMTQGRQAAAAELERRISAAAKAMNLGVTITSVGIQAVHPPASVAPAYEEVLKAERSQDVKRFEAQAYANKVLAEVAGDPTTALKLALATRVQEQLQDLADLQGRTDERDRKLAEYVENARQGVRMAEQDVAREDLTGLSKAAGTPSRTMLDEYKLHAAMLEDIQARLGRGEKYDFVKAMTVADARVEELFSRSSGKPVAMVSAAKGLRWGMEMNERARAEAFTREMDLFHASPRMYKLDRWLDAWDAVLPGITKYVVGVDPAKVKFILNTQRQGGLMDGSIFGGESTSPGGK